MNRFKRYPSLTVLTLLSLIVLVSLSVWQAKRLAWKEALIANINQEMNAAPVPLKGDLPEFRRVYVRGILLPEKTFLHQARYYKGNLGFHLITPMQLTDGRVVLINRGWVPKDVKTNPKAKPRTPFGPITIIGIVRKSEKAPYSFLPQNDPAKGFWLWQDVEGWAKAYGTEPLLIQELAPGQDVIFPIALETQFEVRNDHLQYAITWAALAIILVIMYWLYTRPKTAAAKATTPQAAAVKTKAARKPETVTKKKAAPKGKAKARAKKRS